MPRGKYKRKGLAMTRSAVSGADRKQMKKALKKIRAAAAGQEELQKAYDRGYDAGRADSRGVDQPSATYPLPPSAPPFARDRQEQAARAANMLGRLSETLNDTAQALMRSIHLMNGEL